jgi:NADPH-dependent 2,4-dienoyl-CoA reductase/sulfur reductase-like enzyme
VHDEAFYGERLTYDRLLLATGAIPRRLSIPGSDLAGLHYLRTLGDSEALREGITSTTRVVVGVGAVPRIELAESTGSSSPSGSRTAGSWPV